MIAEWRQLERPDAGRQHHVEVRVARKDRARENVLDDDALAVVQSGRRQRQAGRPTCEVVQIGPLEAMMGAKRQMAGIVQDFDGSSVGLNGGKSGMNDLIEQPREIAVFQPLAIACSRVIAARSSHNRCGEGSGSPGARDRSLRDCVVIEFASALDPS